LSAGYVSYFLTRAFRHILKADCEKHGVDNYTIAHVVNTFQQDVDNVVDTAATTEPGENEEEVDEEDQDED
jgi:hypothetical protein